MEKAMHRGGMENPAEKRKLSEGMKFLLTGAAGGIMLGLLLGFGLMGG